MLYSEQVFDWLRKRLGITHDEHGPAIYPANIVGKLFECFWCLSLIIALLASLAAAGVSGWAWVPVVWLATAAGAIITEKWIGRSRARR
jgi:hypothetical protein